MNHHDPGGDRAHLEGVVEHGAPGDPGRVAEAEEAQRGLGEDRDRHGQRGVREHHRHHVGQHVPADLVRPSRRRGPGRARGRARSLIESVWLRISSAVPGHEVTPITMTMLSSDRPSTRRQHDRQRQERDHQEPLGEPEQDGAGPARRSSPTSARPGCRSPSRSGSRVSPTNSEIRAPQISSVSTDRPLSSVPSQYSVDGGSSTPPVALVTSSPSAGGEHRRQHGDQDEEREDRPGPTIPERCRPELPPAACPAARGDGAARAPARTGRAPGCRRRRAHVRTRGSSEPVDAGWRPGWPGSRPPRRPGRCPGAPSSPAPSAPRWPAARARGSRRPSRR